MCKQCLPGSFFSTHAQEPGNEAVMLRAQEISTTHTQQLLTGSSKMKINGSTLLGFRQLRKFSNSRSEGVDVAGLQSMP